MLAEGERSESQIRHEKMKIRHEKMNPLARYIIITCCVAVGVESWAIIIHINAYINQIHI